MKKTTSKLASLLMASSLLAACGAEGALKGAAGNAGGEASDDQLQVVASFYPMYEFASEVAGDRANVEMVLSSNQDAHSFEPSAQDVAKVNDSDVFVYSSDEMEFWASDLLETIENDDLVVAKAIDGVEASIEADHEHAHGHGHDDEEGHHHDEDERGHRHDDEEGHHHDDEEGHHHDEDDRGHGHDDEEGYHHDEDGHGHRHGDASNDDIQGISGHYHSGDTATLQATVTNVDEITWVVEENGNKEEITQPASEAFEHSLNNGSATVYYIADGEQSEPVTLHVNDHNDTDPHIWLDPVYVKDQVDTIADAFIEADPEGEETYRQNADDFKQQLDQLNEDYEASFEGAENRNFVVQHEAFSYLANRYNLNQIAIGGLSTEVEPSPSRLVEVGKLVEEYDVPVIYYQEGADSSIAETIANETNTEVAVLYDLEILSKDIEEQGLGYIEAMEQNLEQLKRSIN